MALSTNLLCYLILDVGVLRLRHLCPRIPLRFLFVFQILRQNEKNQTKTKTQDERVATSTVSLKARITTNRTPQPPTETAAMSE